MARWDEVKDSEADFAEAVRARFDAHRHKILATLRTDGSPRVSGIEAAFADGDLWLGMMGGSRKALDLRRDPRLALHSASLDPLDDPGTWQGDAKLSGRAVEVTDPASIRTTIEAMGEDPAEVSPESTHLFRVDVTEVTLIRVGDPADHLVIDLWREGQGLRRIQRR